MANTYIGGGSTTGLIAWEDPDAWNSAAASHTASDETYMPLGQGIEISVARNNEVEKVYGIGNRNASASIWKQYSGVATINGTLSNAYWLLGVLGANTDGGVAGAYTHTYAEANKLPSFTLKSSMDLGTTDFTSIMVGARISSCTITAALNEAVKFTLECPYRYETTNTTFVSNLADVEPIFTFAHGSLEMPDGTKLAAVQSFELTILNELEPVYEVGSRFMVDNVAKNREYNFTINAAFKDPAAIFNYFLNGTDTATAPSTGSGTEVATLELTFTNDDGDILDINLTGVRINEESMNQNIGEVMKEDVTGIARACTNIIYTNDVQTAPAEADNV